jgi:SAM-dependent methyltransferase
MGGTVLELCAGDAFYDYMFYRHRASKIVCVDINPEPYYLYKRVHQAPNIEYHLGDVMAFDAGENLYDVAIIRGAIEHFTEEGQQKIFRKALKALKVGGWFCGDTPANHDQDHKMLDEHEFEWKDEVEMRRELVKTFDHVETRTLVSKDRTTLFWRCKKIKP